MDNAKIIQITETLQGLLTTIDAKDKEILDILKSYTEEINAHSQTMREYSDALTLLGNLQREYKVLAEKYLSVLEEVTGFKTLNMN